MANAYVRQCLFGIGPGAPAYEVCAFTNDC